MYSEHWTNETKTDSNKVYSKRDSLTHVYWASALDGKQNQVLIKETNVSMWLKTE